MKLILREVDSRSVVGSEVLLSVSQYTGVLPRKNRERSDEQDSRSESLIGYKKVTKGDLVVNIMLAWNGSLGVSNFDGVVSPAYCVYRLDGDNHPEYFHHLLRTDAYKGRIKVDSRGVVDSRLRLYSDSLFRIEVPVPPASEQQQIARFVRTVDSKVNRLIKAKLRLIELLNEQKQAIIHRVVTRGLDSTVPLKPSGIDWLGDIPIHWRVLPLKRWVSTKITDGPHETPEFLDSGVDFVSAEAMVNGKIDFSRRRGFISTELHERYCQKCRPQRNDIFMCKSGATTGKVSIVETDAEFSVWSPLALIRTDSSKVNPHLLFRVLQSSYVMEQVRDSWTYGTQPNLGMAKMERIFIALPDAREQEHILQFLESEMRPFEDASAKALAEIDLIREYRTRLVADVVTGQLDVRHLDLPEIEDTLIESIESTDVEVDVDETDDILEEAEV